MILPEEVWFPLKYYELTYEISSFLRIRIKKTKRILFGWKTNNGYIEVELAKNGKRKKLKLHRLIAIQFIPNPENKEQVNHKNGIRDDNRITNLEWVTPDENILHSYKFVRPTQIILCDCCKNKLSEVEREKILKDLNFKNNIN
jgi:hypothetical protein